MKSHLTGNPEIRLALNEDLSIGTSDYRARVNVELEPGAVGHTTDFKEANKRLERGIKKKVVDGSELTLRANLTFSRNYMEIS
ncbi:hypothetical protein KIW84_057126 [Lathyrus oleraceus]|uniref:Uncharacterized protein n=1 Tax=Pisum sativum TaxID=3888 RepID=A0A9D4X513_PEA|nr:hypothetical protein KIW84_057126 [Pisum sativum]